MAMPYPHVTEPITLAEYTSSGHRLRESVLRAFSNQTMAARELEDALEQAIEAAHRAAKRSDPPPSLRPRADGRMPFDSIVDDQLDA